MSKIYSTSQHKTIVNGIFGLIILLSLAFPQGTVFADAVLSVTPITWNVIGLDSNDPLNAGPENFPIGVRVCNTGDTGATGVTATFDWGDPDTHDLYYDDPNPDPYINLRPGTNSQVTIATLAAGACSDAYFEVKVTRSMDSYNKTRRYHVDVTSTSPGGTVTTSTPRELFVEHLISQSRNYIYDIKVGAGYSGTGTSVPPGGAMTLMVGQTYDITINGKTATQGYNQLEEFINFPNTIFQVLKVATSYSADNSPPVAPPFQNTTMLYGDACKWDSDPGSPTYRSCIGGDYKNGGSVDITYTVKILSVPSAPTWTNPEPLSTLIYDFSGSSYHYNSDFGISTRYANIIGPSSITIDKSFTPTTIAPNAASVMTIKLTNPTPETFTNVNFSDGDSPAFPAGLQVAATPGVTYSGCGAGVLSKTTPATNVLTGGETKFYFLNGTLSPNSTCTITVNMTATANGTYPNTTGHLFINGTVDTGNSGNSTLYASSSSAPPSSCPGSEVTLAAWEFESGGTGTNPTYTSPAGTDVTPAAQITGSNPAATISTARAVTATHSWLGNGWPAPAYTTVPAVTSLTTYYDFSLDYPVNKYGGIFATFQYYLENADWGNSGNNALFLYAKPDSGSFDAGTAINPAAKGSWQAGTYSPAAAYVGATKTTVRISATGAQNTTARMYLDSVVFKGCLNSNPSPPSISKSFAPISIPQNTNSTLTFTVTNPNSGSALSGVAFTDVLPAGLSVADSTVSACGGTNNLTTTAATRTIALTGGTLAAGGTCSINVTVTGTTAGQYQNISGNITSTQSGVNTSSSGYATAPLTVVAPPTISKKFGATTIFTSGSNNYTSLSFTITNPNSATVLNGISFTDNLPAGLVISTPSGLSGSCGTGTITATAGTSTISLGTPTTATLADGGSCTFSVNVTGTSATPNTKLNTTANVTSTEGGNGNPATASLVVNDLNPSIDLTKQISTAAGGPWYTNIGVNVGTPLYYRFMVYNSGDVNFTAIGVSDPTLLALVPSLDSATCAWKDSAGAAFVFPLTPGNTAYCVLGSTPAVTGSHSNTATVTGAHASGTKTATSTATYGTPQVSLVKSFQGKDSFTIDGDQLEYTYTVTNSGAIPLIGPVTVTDTAGSTPVTVVCPAVSTVGDGDGWLDPVDHPTAGNPAESIVCKAESTNAYTVTAADVLAGSVTNDAYASVSGVSSTHKTLTAYLAALTIDKDTTTPNVGPNGTAIYSIVVKNTGQMDLTNFQVTDTLPFTAGQYSTPVSVAATVDSGTITPSATYTGAGNLLAGTDTLVKGATATITVTVTLNGATAKLYDVNTAVASTTQTGNVDDDGFVANDPGTPGGGVDPATDEDITVGSAVNLGLTKADGVASVSAGGTTTYTMTVTNNGTVASTGTITMVDVLPTGLSITNGAVTLGGAQSANWTCNAATNVITCTSTTVIAAGGTSEFSFPVDVAANATGPLLNKAQVGGGGDPTNPSAPTSTTAGQCTATDTPNEGCAVDSDAFIPLANLSVTKDDGVTIVNPGTAIYTIVVANAGPSSANNAVFTDPSIAGLSVTNVACGSATGGASCPAVGATTVALMQGTGIIIPTLPSGGSVTFTVTATVTATGGTLSNVANVTPPAGTTDPNNANNTATDIDIVVLPPTIAKSFGAVSIPANVNAATTLSFTITNPNTATTLNGINFADSLPAGLIVSTPNGLVGTCGGGTITATAGTGIVDLVGATLAASGSCTFSVDVTGTTAGFKNNSVTVDSTEGGTGNTSNTSLTVVLPPTIAKAFGTNPIVVNGTSVITFTVTNPAANTVALTNVNFTDTYPTGLQNAAVPNASTTCSGGTLTAAANGPSVSLSGATLAINSSCTLTVTVTGTTAGTKTNTVTVSSTNGGTGNTSTAKLGVIGATKTVVATSEDSTTGSNVAIGEVIRYRLVVDLPEGLTTNLQLIDSIVTNMAYLNDNSTRVAFVCNSGPACASSSNAAIGSNPVISGNSAVTPTFVLPAASITGGGAVNPYADGVDPTFSLVNVTNNDNDTDAEYVVIEFNSIVRNVAANQDGNTRGNTFTVNVNGAALTNTTSGVNDQVNIIEPALTAFTKTVTSAPTDAGDTISYQLTFRNTGNAPAFDIVVTDALNAVLTTPVTVTGSTTSGTCGSTVSTVSGSYTAPNATATVTCLAAGETATIDITATVSGTALAGYSFNNSASLTYTSLPGATGTPSGSGGNNTGSSNPGAAGSGNGERIGTTGTNDYTAATTPVTTTLANPSIAKAINPIGTQYAIGATIPYQITITVPEGVTGNPIANLVETIPTGLSYVAGSLTVTPQAGVTIGTAGPYTDANAAFYNLTGQVMTLTFGRFTSTASAAATDRTITVSFLASVNNVVGNQSGTTFTNSVDFNRTNPNVAGTLTLNATDATASVIEPVLSVSKATSTSTPAYNSTLTYTLTVNHGGLSNAPAYDAVIADTLPAGLTGLTNVNITSAAPANCATGVVDTSTASALNVTVGTIPLGCVVTITYDVTVSGALASTQTNGVNVTWTSGSGSVTGERTGAQSVGGALNDYAAATSQSVTIAGPDLNVVKTDGSATYTAGASISYTITATNTGNVTATGTVTDTFPVALTGITWTCAGTGGATCSLSGSGNISDAVSIPAGQHVTYTITATVLSSTTGNLANTASAALTTGTDPTPLNNSSTDTDTPNPQSDLEIIKSDGVAAVNAGGTTAYTIRVTNNGPSDVTGATLRDVAAAGLTKTGVACSTTPGQCVTDPTVVQLEAGFALPDLASGQFYEITVSADVIATSGSVTNTATVAAPAGTNDPTPGNNSASDVDTVTPRADLEVTKDDSVSTVNTGGTTSYTLVVTNHGPSTANNSTIRDAVAAGLTKTAIGTCTAAGGAVCPTVGTGVGQMNITNLENGTVVIPTLPNGGSISFTVTVNVTALGGTVDNVFTATPPAGTTDPTPATVTDIDTVNGFPVADNDTAANVAEDSGTTNIVVLTNDTFGGDGPGTGAITVTPIPVGVGTALVNDGGTPNDPTDDTIDFTPAANYSGPVSITYQICDSNGDCDTAVVTFNVTPVDDLPVANDNTPADVAEDSGTTNIAVLGNDSFGGDGPGVGAITVTPIPVGVGTAVVNDGGTPNDPTDDTIDFTPAANYTGPVSITYAICDVDGDCDTALVTFNVTPVNDPPVANNDSTVTQLNTPVTFSATDNDTDSDGTIDVATVDLDPSTPGRQTTFTVPLQGTFTVDNLGNVTFTPIATFTGVSTIPYTVQDNNGATSNQANLRVTVNMPSLTILKEVSVDNTTWNDTSMTVNVGDTVYYRITVENTGSIALTNVNVVDTQCTLSGPTGDTGGDGILGVTETWVYICSTTAVVGTHTNTASVTTTELPTPETDDASYDGLSADLSLTKTVDNSSPRVGDNISFDITVTNKGPSNATGVVVADLLPAGLAYVSDNGGGAYNSATGVWTIGALNTPIPVILRITAKVMQAGSITNTAQVMTSDQMDPNSTPGNNIPTEDDQDEVTIGGIFDPPSAIKTFDDAGLPELEYRMVWINSGNTLAIDVQVTDEIPVGTTYVTDSINCEPRGSSANSVAVSSPLSSVALPDSFCGYDAAANRIQWQGNIGPDDGNLTEDDAANEVVITFRVRVNDGVNQVQNEGFSRTDVNADASFSDEVVWGTSLVGSNRVVWRRSLSGVDGPDDGEDLPNLLPTTGFAPNVVTDLPQQPIGKAYASTDVWLEIPSLGVEVPVVGVPVVDGEWDLSWLADQAGWLSGTAFPSWEGNSALTGHVTLSNGQPGPFAKLDSLKWDDRIIIHAYGYAYEYRVRENKVIAPADTSMLRHEDDAWLTLITCKSYDQSSNTYKKRVAIRAALAGVTKEEVVSRSSRGR